MTAAPEEAPLAARAGRALGWSFASTVVGRLSTLVIAVALARILGPAEFGVYAVAMVVLLAVLSFNELGVSLAIVRWPGDPREIAPTVMTLSTVASLVVYAGCWFAAPAFTALMGEPGATAVVRVITLGVVVSGLVAAPVAVLQREFQQGKKLVADQVSTWVSAGTSIGCALAGLGAMSLAYGYLAGVVVGAVVFAVFVPGAFRFGFDRARAVALLRFGLPLAGSSIFVFAAGNVDRLVVGAVLGPVPLGIYVLATNLSNWPLQVFSTPVRAVAPAALARLQHDPATMRRFFLDTGTLLGAVALPACALLGGAADPVIRFVYGTDWTAAIPVLPWLAAAAALRILFELAYDWFVVLAATRVVFTAQLVLLVALVPTSLVAAHVWGTVGAAAAQLVVGALFVAPVYVLALRRRGVAGRAVLRGLALPAAAAVVVAGLARWISSTSWPDVAALLVTGAVAALVVGTVLWSLRRVVSRLREVTGAPVAVDVPAIS